MSNPGNTKGQRLGKPKTNTNKVVSLKLKTF